MACLLPSADTERGEEATAHESAKGGVRAFRDELALQATAVAEHEGVLSAHQLAVA